MSPPCLGSLRSLTGGTEVAAGGAATSSVASARLPDQRHLFDLPYDVAYLNCAYMAPQLRSVTAAVATEAPPDWIITPRVQSTHGRNS